MFWFSYLTVLQNIYMVIILKLNFFKKEEIASICLIHRFLPVSLPL